MALEFQETELFYEGVVYFNLFGCEVDIYVHKENLDFAYAERCARALNEMSEVIIDKLCAYSTLYCNDFCDQVGEDPPAIHATRDVLQYIQPSALIVQAPEDASTVLHLELNCDWEEEHGLEWLIKDDVVLYVGAFNDEPAYAEEEYYKNSWNYVHFAAEAE